MTQTYLALISVIVTNACFLLSMLIGELVIFRFSKLKHLTAHYSVLIGVLLLLYVISNFWFSAASLFSGIYLYAIVFAVYAIVPFVIGYFVTFKKKKLYVWLQIFVLCSSLAYAVDIFVTVKRLMKG